MPKADDPLGAVLFITEKIYYNSGQPGFSYRCITCFFGLQGLVKITLKAIILYI